MCGLRAMMLHACTRTLRAPDCCAACMHPHKRTLVVAIIMSLGVHMHITMLVSWTHCCFTLEPLAEVLLLLGLGRRAQQEGHEQLQGWSVGV
jgi:hypothetical protein